MASATTKDMTHGVPWRLIAGFAIPVFLSQLFQQLYNTADSLIVSNFLGDNALAARQRLRPPDLPAYQLLRRRRQRRGRGHRPLFRRRGL